MLSHNIYCVNTVFVFSSKQFTIQKFVHTHQVHTKICTSIYVQFFVHQYFNTVKCQRVNVRKIEQIFHFTAMKSCRISHLSRHKEKSLDNFFVRQFFLEDFLKHAYILLDNFISGKIITEIKKEWLICHSLPEYDSVCS